jgi:hypothetical protein
MAGGNSDEGLRMSQRLPPDFAVLPDATNSERWVLVPLTVGWLPQATASGREPEPSSATRPSVGE